MSVDDQQSTPNLFSYRMGLRKNKKTQLSGMDNDLRNRIWNYVYSIYFSKVFWRENYSIVCDGFFKERLNGYADMDYLAGKYLSLEWDRVYDFIDFVLGNCKSLDYVDVISNFNKILEEEFSGYRIINNKVIPITNKIELSEIKQASSTGKPSVDKHMNSALAIFSDRKNPDPRNTIKESISALEALLRKASGNDDLSLGRALDDVMKRPNSINQNLKDAIKSLYKFTNDSSGVRHSHADSKQDVTLDDAQFVLVTCSAIINYLIIKKVGKL